ncbi:MAG: ABC transporter permease [Ilumatobacteraceae bacterium]
MTTTDATAALAPADTAVRTATRGNGRSPTTGGRSLVRVPAVVGLVPFVAFVGVFLLFPAVTVFVKAFEHSATSTKPAMLQALDEPFRDSFVESIKLSVLTAVIGGVIGVLLAFAVVNLRRPKWLRTFATSFGGVAANLGGVPLAFAFIAALGVQGLATKILDTMGINFVDATTLGSNTGLTIVYLYFQIPLMMLVVLPAIDGLQTSWREAAANLGAGPATYWRRVGGPILAPSILGGLLLLFANSFSAYATAFAISTGASRLAPVQIRFFLQGDQSGYAEVGYAMAAWMIIIALVAMGGYLLLRRRAERWRR